MTLRGFIRHMVYCIYNLITIPAKKCIIRKNNFQMHAYHHLTYMIITAINLFSVVLNCFGVWCLFSNNKKPCIPVPVLFYNVFCDVCIDIKRKLTYTIPICNIESAGKMLYERCSCKNFLSACFWKLRNHGNTFLEHNTLGPSGIDVRHSVL